MIFYAPKVRFILKLNKVCGGFCGGGRWALSEELWALGIGWCQHVRSVIGQIIDGSRHFVL